ncbi:MAG TPA: hypothetical protein VM734_29360 [Kofleriaceae bacterium]|nr:hypothetical protein [Kofleriaceae bacterium]
MTGRGQRDRLAENPFFVLGLTPAASAREVEREAQKLLGMLELGLAAAATYATPLGPRSRTAEAVRSAAAALRDPRQRLLAELWAAGGDAEVPAATAATADAEVVAWPEALTASGWVRRGEVEP